MKDYGFIPGNPARDSYIKVLRIMTKRRKDTTLVPVTKKRSTVRDFVSYLSSTASVAKPIDNMLLGTHASSMGRMTIRMYSGQKGKTTFETLTDTMGNASYSIKVPDNLIGHNPGDAATKNLHIKGCNIGKAVVFLARLKVATGNNLNITAPLHYHAVSWLSTHGTWEFMAYEFVFITPKAFENRTALLNKLKGINDPNPPNFNYYDANTVSAADWEKWVPKKITKSSSTKVDWLLGKTFGKRTTLPFKRKFIYRKRRQNYVIKYGAATQVPKTEATQKSALSSHMDKLIYRKTDALGAFDPMHDWPEYERWGYSSKQEYIDSRSWKFVPKGKNLYCYGVYHEYEFIVPITVRGGAGDGNLIYNFYPKQGSAVQPVTDGLVETDNKFFATV